MFFYFVVSFFVILFLYYFYFFKKKKVSIYSKYGVPFFCLFLSIILLLCSLYDFKNFETKEKGKIKSSNVIFLIDVSKTMQAKDDYRNSRLDIAKSLISQYVETHKSYNFGLIGFSSSADVIYPLGDDIKAFKSDLEYLKVLDTYKSFNIYTDSINKGIERIKQNNFYGSIVILSDFDIKNTDEIKNKGLDNLKKVIRNNKKNIKYYTVGIGSKNKIGIIKEEGFFLKKYEFDNEGKMIKTGFDVGFFKKLSNILSSDNSNVITSISDIKNFDLKSLPSDYKEYNDFMSAKITRYLIILSMIVFFLYLMLFNYYQKNEKN